MNRYLLSLGSNENKVENMAKCRSLLNELYSLIRFSEMIETEPFGEDFVIDFCNQLAVVDSENSVDELKFQLKCIERKIGRQPEDKSKGIVKIDLDLLAINNDIVKKEDFERPYLKKILTDFSFSIDTKK